ncbi:MAG TPA: hypothetical protein VHE35_24275, partial [Kofleriaceae bacterium]|nr:hypothetical protein [Kofleriaceae bacterium]
VCVAVVVDDVAAFAARLEQHARSWAHRPAVARAAAVARALEQRGFQPDLVAGGGPVLDAFHELVGEAPMRVFAVIAAATSAAAWPAERAATVTGLLATRFRKRDHGLAQVVVRADRRRDAAAAITAARAELDDDAAAAPAPELVSEPTATGRLTGLADALAALVHDARQPADLPHGVRLKLVHIYDRGAKRNYGLDDVFP